MDYLSCPTDVEVQDEVQEKVQDEQQEEQDLRG